MQGNQVDIKGMRRVKIRWESKQYCTLVKNTVHSRQI